MNKPKTRKYILIAIFVLSFFYLKFIMAFTWLALIVTYLIFAVLFAAINIWAVIAFIGNYLFNTGKLEQASKVFDFCIRHKSKYPTVYLNQSIMLVKEGKAREALDYLEKALMRTPKVITEKNILLTMGSCYWVLGDIDRAIEVLEGLRNKYEYVNAHVLTTLGYMYFIKGDSDTALELTRKAIDDTEDYGAAWDNLGQIYYKNGQIPEAKEAFLKAIEYKGDLVDSLYYLARVSEDENDIQSAKEYYQKAKNCKISALNTVKAEQIDEGYEKCLAKISAGVNKK